MTDLNETVTKEINDMFDSLISAKEPLRKQFDKIFDEYLDSVFNKFSSHLEDEAPYHFKSWVTRTCDEIIERLLAGDIEWVKDKAIISGHYDWGRIRDVRLAILKAANGEIENTVIRDLQFEVERLKEDVRLANRREYY